MYLICFGTRPELIKLIPIINILKKNNIKFKTLFSGQHENLIKDFYKYIDEPDYIFTNIMEHGQTLNELSSKILLQSNKLFRENLIKVKTFITLKPELVEKKEPPSITSIRKTKTRFLGTCSNEIPIFETLLEIDTSTFKKLLS